MVRIVFFFHCIVVVGWLVFFFFFKQKTAYEMRISDWSSDVCSSDLGSAGRAPQRRLNRAAGQSVRRYPNGIPSHALSSACAGTSRSEEHTSELQSLMRISYAVFCLKKKKKTYTPLTYTNITTDEVSTATQSHQQCVV